MVTGIGIEARVFIALASCALLLTTTGCGQNRDADRPQPSSGDGGKTAIPSDAADVSLKILDYPGIERLIADRRGKVVVLDVWSTACPPCVKEFPDLVSLYRRIGAKRLACISLSLDYDGAGKAEDAAPAVLAFLRKQNARFDNVLASVEPEAILKQLEIPSIPAVFVFDRSGMLREKFTDGASSKGRPVYDRVEELVNQLLAEK
ncbi:MAG TPA: TlpA disulfide reductase family protein [Pirellulales bacterium]|jgi:thiol-disulfide isomerase/thioredoxin|nr:TlpA disulfide reductase family protein [Pirellulales bacterium]